jgi:hypothetical protein
MWRYWTDISSISTGIHYMQHQQSWVISDVDACQSYHLSVLLH